jgi:hypothetical protein
MQVGRTDRVCHVLALGPPAGDGHRRIARGGWFDVLEGSEESHQAMLSLCLRLQRALQASGRDLGDLTRAQFVRLLRRLPP